MAGLLYYLTLVNRPDDEKIRDLYRAHRHLSGIHPALYTRFVTNLELMTKDPKLAHIFLYRAMNNLEEFIQYAPDHSDEIDLQHIGEVGVKYILEHRLLTGGLFVPKYLNNKL